MATPPDVSALIQDASLRVNLAAAPLVVDGKVIMRNREILTIDTKQIRTEATQLAARIQSALEEQSD